MKDFANYYDVLRISGNAFGEEIKKAYRKLVLQFHPDRVSPDAPDLKDLAEEEFKRIQEAYDVLSVPEKRKQYDEQLKNLKAEHPAVQGSSQPNPVLRVDKNYFKFDGANISLSEILTIVNDGGGILIGTITADKPWVKLSETVISTPDYQEIEITIDSAFLSLGFGDSALVEIDTSGGNETVAVDVSITPLSNADIIIVLARSLVSQRWFKPLFFVSILLAVVSLFHEGPVSNHGGRVVPQAARSGSPAKDVSAYQALFDKRGPPGYAPVVVEYLRKEEMEKVPADEGQGIFYPETGAFYPIKKSRYPEFYRKCDLDGDGIVTLYELGKAQQKFNRITAKYREGDVDSIVKEFVK